MESYSETLLKIDNITNKLDLLKKDRVNIFLTVKNVIVENNLTDIIPSNIEKASKDNLIIRLNVLEEEISLSKKEIKEQILEKINNIKKSIITKNEEQKVLEEELEKLNKVAIDRKKYLINKYIIINDIEEQINKLTIANEKRKEMLNNLSLEQEEKSVIENTINKNNIDIEKLTSKKEDILKEDNLREDLDLLKQKNYKEIDKKLEQRKNSKDEIIDIESFEDNIINKITEVNKKEDIELHEDNTFNEDNTINKVPEITKKDNYESHQNEEIIKKIKSKKTRIILGITALTSIIVLPKVIKSSNKKRTIEELIEQNKIKNMEEFKKMHNEIKTLRKKQ